MAKKKATGRVARRSPPTVYDSYASEGKSVYEAAMSVQVSDASMHYDRWMLTSWQPMPDRADTSVGE